MNRPDNAPITGFTKPKVPEGGPLRAETVAESMKIDVTVNEDGQVYVIHDQPFPTYLEWIEFDSDTGAMTFVTPDGRLQDLGMTIHPPMDAYVAKARQACVILIRDGAVRDIGLVPMMIQEYGLIGGGRHA